MTFVNIDPRIKAWSPAKLRTADTPRTLREAVADSLIILQDSLEPIAVLVSYERYIQIQAAAKPAPPEAPEEK